MKVNQNLVVTVALQTVLGLSGLTLNLPILAPAMAQGGPAVPAGVSMTMYKLDQSRDGKQFFVNNAGQQIFLPGIGAKGNDLPIYTGPKGGVWYVDRDGKPNQIMGPQNASGSVTNNYYQQPTNNSGSSTNGVVGSTMGAAVGAAAGSMLGASMYNNQYQGYYHGSVPYGAAMYYDNNNKPYYMNNGTKAYVNNDVTVNNQHFNNWQNQASVYDRQVVNSGGEWHGQYNQNGGYAAPYGGYAAANQYQNNQEQQQREAAAHGAEASNAYHNNQQAQNEQAAARGAAASNDYHNNQQAQNEQSAARGAEANNAYKNNQSNPAAAGAAADGLKNRDGDDKGRFGGDAGGRFGGDSGGAGGRFSGGGGGRFSGGGGGRFRRGR